MKRSALASRLIQTRRSAERKKLLRSHANIADIGLARALKDHCYRVWTSDPADAQRSAAALQTLADFTSDKEIRALAFWINGVADITRGKLELAVKNLDSASRSLSRLGNENESAQPLVAKLIALAMLGRYDAAQKTGERALEIFRKYGDTLAAGKIEMNLSNIVSRRDQYRLAERYCLSAYRRFKKLGETSWQTMAENGLANTYAELNDFKRAEKFYEQALVNARRARMSVTVAEIEASMGNLALFRGMYAEAIRRLELSRQKYESLRMPHQTAIAELEIADIYAELNLNDEAIDLYRRLIPFLHRLKLRAEEARARANLGRVLMSASDTRNARAELRRAARLFELEKNDVGRANVQLRLSALESSIGNNDAALALAKRTASTFEKRDNTRLRLSAMWLEGDLLRKLNRLEESKRLIDKTLKLARSAEQPAIVHACLNSLGLLSRELGDTNRAVKYFETAIDAVEAARDPLPGEEFRMAFLAKSLEPFDNLSRLYTDLGKIENAFVTIERGRSRALLDAVTNGTRRTSSDASGKLRDELNWLYSRLARAEDDEIERIRKQIRAREKDLAEQSLRQQSASRARVAKRSTGLDLKTLQTRLGSSQALIEFVESDGWYSAFVVTSDRIEYVAKLISEAEVR
jgi:tetratricopeptide (TPR) repeat protein